MEKNIKLGLVSNSEKLAVCIVGQLFPILGSLLKRTLLQSKCYSGKSEVILIKAKLLKVKHFLTRFFRLAKTTLEISWHCKLQPLRTTVILQAGLLHLGLSGLDWRTVDSKTLFSWNLHVTRGFFLSVKNNWKKIITNCLRHFSPIKTTSWMRYHQALGTCDWNPFLLIQEVSLRAVPKI